LGFISPVVAKIAREHNADLQQVTGSGADGRITKKDILAYIESGKKAETTIWETPADGDLFHPTELVFGKQDTPAPVPLTPDTGTRNTGIRDTLIPHTTPSANRSPSTC